VPSARASDQSARPVARTNSERPPTMIKVPKGVGLDHQSAQDAWRAAGLHVQPA
jgi:hypothetical protein